MVVAAFRWLGTHAWWIFGAAAVLAVLIIACGCLAVRALRRVKRADLAQLTVSGQAWRDEMAAPQVSKGTPAAIEQHVHYHYHAADAGQATPVMRGKVLP